MKKSRESRTAVLLSCCIVGISLLVVGIVAAKALSAPKFSFVTVNWRPGVVYAASPYCRIVQDKTTGEQVPFVVLDTKTMLPTTAQFCSIGLFEVAAVSSDAQLVIIKADRLEGSYFAVESALAWENSAADPFTDPSGTHPTDVGHNSFRELSSYMCKRGTDYLLSAQRMRYCP